METPTQMIERWAKEDREYLESLERKKWYGRVIMGVLFMLIIVMAGVGNAPHLAVEVPVVDSAALQRLQQENEVLQRKVADYKALSANLAGRLKEANGRLAKLEEEHIALAHSSLPPQPVILRAIQKEASTPEGLKHVVARSFGKELAGRIRVVE